MPYLLDTSVLMRLANIADPNFAVADRAVAELRQQGEGLFVTAQNFIEFRNVATRPKFVNGLGLTAAETEAKAAIFERAFLFLDDTPDIYVAWKTIVASVGVIGKQVHDARLAAVCHVHKVTHVLTFNTGHFKAFAAFGAGLTVVDPANV